MTKTDLHPEAVAAPPHSPRLESTVERLIKPAKRRLKARDLLGIGQVVRVLASRDLKIKYKQSLLGPLWLIFQPLALLGAFLVAFRGLSSGQTGGAPYVLFALVGLSVWSFFQSAMTIGTPSVVMNINFVRYTPCPRHAFPVAAVLAALPSFAVTAVAALLATAATGHLSPRVILLPLVLLWLMLLTLGVISVTSTLAVRYRDINSALPFLLQIGLFLAPVGYPIAKLSHTVRTLVELNPFTGVLEATRWTMLSGYECALAPVLFSLGLTALLVIGGWRLFTLRETTMADEI